MSNLPPNYVPLDVLKGPLLRRWKRYIEELRLTGNEQTGQPVIAALRVGDLEEAL
jgi:hypothetical protein